MQRLKASPSSFTHLSLTLTVNQKPSPRPPPHPPDIHLPLPSIGAAALPLSEPPNPPNLYAMSLPFAIPLALKITLPLSALSYDVIVFYQIPKNILPLYQSSPNVFDLSTSESLSPGQLAFNME